MTPSSPSLPTSPWRHDDMRAALTAWSGGSDDGTGTFPAPTKDSARSRPQAVKNSRTGLSARAIHGLGSPASRTESALPPIKPGRQGSFVRVWLSVGEMQDALGLHRSIGHQPRSHAFHHDMTLAVREEPRPRPRRLQRRYRECSHARMLQGLQARSALLHFCA